MMTETISLDATTYFRTLAEDAAHWTNIPELNGVEDMKAYRDWYQGFLLACYDLCPPVVQRLAGWLKSESEMPILEHWKG